MLAHTSRSITALAVAATFVATVGAQSTTRVSVNSAGTQGNGGSFQPECSRDGRFVAFVSSATNLVPNGTNGSGNVFVRDRLSGQTTLVSISTSGVQGSGEQPGISADGRFVVFFSYAQLAGGDGDSGGDIFVRDRQLATTTLVSVASSGAQVPEDCSEPAISGDGSRVSFNSGSTSLVPGDTNGFRDVFVHDRVTGSTQCVSVSPLGVPANGESTYSDLSMDGRWVVFESYATNLVPGGNPFGGVFVRDLVNGTTSFVALGQRPGISDDGNVVVFNCPWDNVVSGDNNGTGDVLVRDMTSGLLSAVSVSPNGTIGNGLSATSQRAHSVISSDGMFVIFEGYSTNLTSISVSDPPGVYVRDRATGLTTLVSVDSNGVPSSQYSLFAGISGDGQTACFSSFAIDLVPGDTNGKMDVFAHQVAFTPMSYCTSATTTHGCEPAIQGVGIASASAPSGFTLEVLNAESNKTGLFFYGLSASSSPFMPGSTSVLCVSAPRQRTQLSNTGGPSLSNCDGVLALDWNAWASTHPNGLGAPFNAGLALYAQGWLRDPGAPGGSNLSNALVFVLTP